MFWKLIATGFGSGYSPFAPGTAGSLVGCLLLWGLQVFLPEQFSGGWQQAHNLLILTGLFFLLGVWASQKMEAEWGHDAQKIVADEIAGVWVAMIAVPVTLLNLALAFALFRLFDIWKPLGIRRMEKLPGGWGVMGDDLLAGIYAGVCLHLALLVF